MPRTVSMRQSYQGDVAALTRLAAAVEKDHRRPEKWRKDTVRSINAVIVQLLNLGEGNA